MPTPIGPVDPAVLIDIDFTPLDTHAYAYRLWWREPGTDWVEIGTGGTATGSTNHFQHAVVANAQLFYVVNVGTAQGQPMPAAYSATLTFRQNGALLASSVVAVTGSTNAEGVATNSEWANFT